jgi:hypothetical protein
MSDDANDTGNDNPNTRQRAEEDLLRAQEGKGYGEDEGEREEALDED